MTIFNENEFHGKIQTKIRGIIVPKEFSTFTKLCRYLDISVSGTNSKKSLKKILAQYMVIKKIDGTNKHVITKVFNYPLPKIDDTIKKSSLYLGCIYFLLVHLMNDETQSDYVFLTKKQSTVVFGLGNSEYCYHNYFDVVEEDATQITKNITLNIFNQIYKKTNDILDAAQKRNFVTFEETYYRYDCNREANDNEKKIINEVRDSIAEEYGLKNYKQVHFNSKRKLILDDIEKRLGYAAYNILKFHVDERLEDNVLYLENVIGYIPSKLDLNTKFCNSIRESYSEEPNTGKRGKKAKSLLSNIDKISLNTTVYSVIRKIIELEDDK